MPTSVGTSAAAGNRASRVEEWAWLCLVAVVPIVINPWGIQVFELPKIAILRAIVICLGALWLWRRFSLAPSLSSRKLNLCWTDPRLWAAVLGLIWIAATVTSFDVGLSLWGSYERQEGLYTTLSYLLLFALVATGGRKPGYGDRLVWALTLGNLPVLLYGLLQWAGLDPIAWNVYDKASVFSTLGRSNVVGSYLIMTIPFCAAALILARSPYVRASLAVVLAASFVLLGLTNARSAWAALVVAGLAFLIWQLTRSRARWLAMYCLPLVVILLILIVFLWVGNLGNYGQPLSSVRLPDLSGSVAARLTIWRATLQLIAERPILGFGPDTFGLAFHHVFPPELVFYQGRDVVTDRAHNMLLQQAASTWVTGLLAYLGLLGTIVAALGRGLRVLVGRRRIVLVAIFVSIIAHLVDQLFIFETAGTAAVFWVVAGVGIVLAGEQDGSLTSEKRGVRRVASILPKRRRFLAGGLSVAVLGLIVGTSAAPLIADTYAGQAAYAGEPTPASLADAERAVAIWPLQPAHWSTLATIQMQSWQQQPVNSGLAEEAERNLDQAIVRQPLDPRLWWQMAELRGARSAILKGPAAFAGAEAAFDRALALAPNAAVLHTAYGALELSGGHADLAVSLLTKAVELDQTQCGAWRYLTDAQRSLGRAPEADYAQSRADECESKLGIQ